MMKRKINGSILSCLLVSLFSLKGIPFVYAQTNTPAPEKYTMADLEILENQKSYEEFFGHALDIRPSKRQKDWREMVSNMALDFIDHNIRVQNYDNKSFLLTEKLSTWPALKSDEFFQIKRNNFALKWLKKCLIKQNSHCRGQISQFWKRSIREPDTGFKIAQLIKGFYPYEDTWQYLSSIVQHKMANFYCHKDIVVNRLDKEIYYQLSEKSLKEKEIKQRLDLLANQTCWSKALPELKNKLLRGQTQYNQTLFLALKSKGHLSYKEEDTFLTLELLKGPSKGVIFNLAWNRLLELGQKPKRRENLKMALVQMDPLPGKVFSSKNTALKTSLLRLFSQNFPEYLDHYGKTCLDYMEGKTSFPHGNPTIECRDLYQFTKGKPWISQGLQLRYSGLKKY